MWTTFKLIVIAAAAALTVSEASALGASANNHLQGCGPESSVYGDLMDQDSTGASDFKIGFKLTWTFGAKEACKVNNAHAKDVQIRELREFTTKRYETEAKARKSNADASRVEAQADQEVVKALTAKIQVCSTFTHETAPESIMDFCGDLLK